MSLKFAPASHRYWLDGKPVQGVTTLIKGGIPTPALVYWSAKCVAEYVADHAAEVETLRAMPRDSMVAALKQVPWTERDAAGARGTTVHALAEKLVHVPPFKRKPYKKKPYGGCDPHHLVWWGGDGKLIIGCAHCRHVSSRTDVSFDNALLVRLIKGSRDGHYKLCKRPIFSA